MADTRSRHNNRLASAAAAEAAKGEGSNGNAATLIRQREKARHIHLHEDEEKAASVKEAVVRKVTDGLPDMRFAENRNKFLKDTSKSVTGKPDSRFLENRPDLIELHEQRGETRPNLIFTDDMDPDAME